MTTHLTNKTPDELRALQQASRQMLLSLSGSIANRQDMQNAIETKNPDRLFAAEYIY